MKNRRFQLKGRYRSGYARGRVKDLQNISEAVEKKYGKYPEKVLQFGEGNFLRAFVDWMIDKANENGEYEGSIVLCQPIEGGERIREFFTEQNGEYTVVMRGIENGEPTERIRPITSVSRCINAYADYEELMKLAESPDLETVVSNTTEAGIAYREGDRLTDTPPASFPAKVTQFLYRRFKAFDGDPDKGLLFLPVELIDNNGAELKRIVLKYADEWNLEPEFISWVKDNNEFTSTLVDRIVTGYPREQAAEFCEKFGYEDNLIDTCELFNLWVIEGDSKWQDVLPVHKSGANVIWTDDVKPYKKRKVRILNGGHTGTVLAAYLAGHDIVLDFMNDPVFAKYLDGLFFEEIIPTLDLPEEELKEFAEAVKDRFSNPYIKHRLLDISLNSCSKFNARNLPTLLDYQQETGKIPARLSFGLASLIKFYDCERKEDGSCAGHRADGSEYPVRDDDEVLKAFEDAWKLGDVQKTAETILGNTDFWSGKDLTEVPGLLDTVTGYLKEMENTPIEQIVEQIG